MTAPLPALLARLALPAELAAPAEGRPLDGEAILGALRAALRGLALPDDAPLGSTASPAVAASAARHLCRAGRFPEALHLLRSGPPDWLAREEAAGPLVRALLKAGHPDDLLAELQRRRAANGEEDPEALRLLAALRTPAVSARLSDPAAAHDAIWGPFLPDLAAKVASLAGLDPRGAALADALVSNLHGLRTDAMAREEFRRRLAFGWFVVGYLAFLRRAREAPDSAGAPGRQLAFRRLAAQTRDLVTLADPDPLASAQGRSVVLALSHSGVVVVASLAGRISALPQSSVAARTRTDGDHLNVRTGDADATRQFLRLAQALRTQRRIVTIVPDGGAGDTHPVEVLGRAVPVGKGAATLAHRGRAATFVARSRWTGRAFAVEIRPGPVGGGDRDAFEAAFFRFYADHLAEILQGPPEDMGAVGGVFLTFAKPGEAQA